MTSPTTPENRAWRRRRGIRRSGSALGLSVLATTGLLGAYLGSPRLPRAYAQASATCGGNVTTAKQLNDAIDAFLLDPTLCDTINITSSFTVDQAIHPIGANSASTVAGAITIQGNGHSIDGDDTYRGIIAFATGGLTITNLTMKDFTWVSGDVTNFGGAAYSYFDLKVSDSTFTGNDAPFGGAVATKGKTSTTTIEGSRFDSNTSLSNGGAVWGDSAAISGSSFTNNSVTVKGGGGAVFSDLGTPVVTDSYFAGNSATRGGALATGDLATGLTITGSTFSGNTAAEKGGAVSTRYQAAATVTNSTFTTNSAVDGGALHLPHGGGIAFTTITANAASGDGGGVWSYYGYTITSSNSIISGNTASGDGADFHGSCYSVCMPIAADYTLFTSNTSALIVDNGGNLVGAPKLGPLGDNGGITVPSDTGPISMPTMLPALDSPAVGAANPITTGFPDYDQRGNPYVRVYDARADLGAVELGPITVTVTPDPKTITFGSPTPSFTFAATVPGTPSPVTFPGAWTTQPSCGVASLPPAPVPVSSYTITCSGGDAGTKYEPAYETGTLTVRKASPSLAYTGGRSVVSGGSLAVSSRLSISACAGPVSYSLGRSPITGAAGTFALAGSPVSAVGWRPGAYTLRARYAGNANCNAASTTAPITVLPAPQRPVRPPRVEVHEGITVTPGRTNAGRQITVSVACVPISDGSIGVAGDVRWCRVTRSGGTWQITARGPARVQITYSAPATATHAAYRKVVYYTLPPG